MNPIPLSILEIGQKTEREYFTSDGEMLISKGIVFSKQHLDALKRRKIDTVYMKDDEEDDELSKILSADFKNLGTISLDDLHETIEADFGGGLSNPELANIKSGREGLEQLLSTKKVLELDATLQEGDRTDIPEGQSLKDRSKEITAKERTDAYKTQVLESYDESLDRTKNILTSLAEGESVANESIRAIVTRFTELYLTDKNILTNIASIKATGDDYLFHHSLNVCILSINIAAAFGYNEQQVIDIGMGALVHDVGMLLIPKKLRLKTGRFAENEWFDIQKHPMLGLHLLEKIDSLPPSVPFIAYQTHERENGKGYPKQRSSRFIHNYAKVVAIADVFEALSSPRVYREGNVPYKAMESLIKMTKQGLLCGDFVKPFLEFSSLFPVGSVVELSNGCIAKVVKANGKSFAKPVVCIFIDASGTRLERNDYFEVDLIINTSIQIIKAHTSTLNDDLMLGF